MVSGQAALPASMLERMERTRSGSLMLTLVVTKGKKMAWGPRKERQLRGLEFLGRQRIDRGVPGREYGAVDSHSRIGCSQ